MKFSTIVLSLLILTSCSKGYNNNSLFFDIMDNKSKDLINGFHKKEELEIKEFKKVVELYSNDIKQNNLIESPFKEKLTFISKKRYGFQFIDLDNNVVSSITYKFTKLKDGSKKIKFIEFRNSEGNLPCVKFPSLDSLECVIKPFDPPADLEHYISCCILREVNGVKLYHAEYTPKDTLEKYDKIGKKRIIFNFGNWKILDNIDVIMSELDKVLNLKEYNLEFITENGQPTTHLIYNSSFDKEELQKIYTILDRTIEGEKMLFDRNRIKRNLGKEIPEILIGVMNTSVRKGYSNRQFQE